MYKYLVVGCGGSGGATLAYLMDQITSELAANGVDEMPAGLQFVHIDVPVAADTNEPGVGTVVAQGGTYIGTAPTAGSYPVLDAAISSQLVQSDGLQHIATWAPREPGRIAVPIAMGAGQMRAVGRMLTLNSARSVRERLSQAADALNTVQANTDMGRVARAVPGAGVFDPATPIVTIVVSSMAGGAGASMALDVCRLLSQMPQLDPNLISAFLITPDVFDSLPEFARPGVLANSLAMLGEIVAAQTGAASGHDRALLGSLGLHLAPSEGAPFKRVFPVGRFSGTERTLFGDGTARAVYRGLGRGLAALMLSGRASGDFVSYDLTTPGLAARQTVFGWGANADDVAWGSFGFGTLSLGRDRYRHYAAQRLARSAADRLVGGHLQPGSVQSSTEQLRNLLDAQWATIADRSGLPAQATPGALSRDEFGAWMTRTALPQRDVDADVRQVVDVTVRPNLASSVGDVQSWLGVVRGGLAAQRASMHERTDAAAYRWAYAWAQRLHDQLLAEVASSVERFGLPFGRAVVERMIAVIGDQIVPQLIDRARAGVPDVGQVPAAFETEASRIRGAVSSGQQLVDRLLTLLGENLSRLRYGRSAQLAADVLQAIVPEVLQPLRGSLSDALEVLEIATAPAAPQAVGLANVDTDRYAAWPSENDAQVPPRFGVADNEVLLTPFEGFAATYQGHLPAAVGGTAPTFGDARLTAARMVIGGRWPVAGGAGAPGGLVETLSRWRAGVFVREPESGEPLQPTHGRYVWHVSTHDLLARAEAFVARPGESFELYASQSLAAYVAARDASPAEAAARRTDLVDRFGEAVIRALPLISVDAEAVRAMHGTGVEYFFKFSAIPFADDPQLVTDLLRRIGAMPNVAGEVTAQNGVMERALVLGTESPVSRVDVFGSYRTYSPVVFDALLRPVAASWAATQEFARLQFWQHRRSRPLTAALPMGVDERRAMIAGWYVGLLTGRVAIPAEPYAQPVRVWDPERGAWIDFPWPLLTPPSQFVGQTFDWLPAVLESVLLAISRSQEPPAMASMRPYQVLRGLWDDTRNAPASGLLSLAAERTLADWLASGQTTTGVPSRVQGGTPAERYDAAVAWMRAVHDFAGVQFMAAGDDGAPGGGRFSTIASRTIASATPVFRDLAEDIWSVTSRLADVLDAARSRGAGPAPTLEPGPGIGPI